MTKLRLAVQTTKTGADTKKRNILKSARQHDRTLSSGTRVKAALTSYVALFDVQTSSQVLSVI